MQQEKGGAIMEYRLGLDVGTNSLGWSVLKIEGDDGKIKSIEAAGSRIFSDGRVAKSQATLAAERRQARSARRRRDRFQQRQVYLLSALTEAKLFPESKIERQNLQKLNPLKLRSNALTQKIEPYEIGRALFHLNQRRGFQSSRKDRSEETTTGKVSTSVRNLLEDMDLMESSISQEAYKDLSKEDKKIIRQQEAKDRQNALKELKQDPHLTYGSFLYKRYKKNEESSPARPISSRARPTSDGKLYDIYPTRELYKDEFNKIWDKQTQYYTFMTKEVKEKLHDIIFFQRPLKPQKRGKCTYMSEYDRTFRAMPSFQRYRIYQEVNSLAWMTSQGEQRVRSYREARDEIFALLEKPTTKKGNVTFGTMKKILKKQGLAEGTIRFNFETEKRKDFDGNLTSNLMQDDEYVGEIWHDWSLNKQDAFITLILDDEKSDEEVKSTIISDYGLSDEQAEKCTNALLVDGTASVSLEAARLMLKVMKERDVVDSQTGELTLPLQSESAEIVAKENENFKDPFRSKKIDSQKIPSNKRLAYYGEVFQDGRHIIPGNRYEEDKGDDMKYYGGITNPTVHIALNQIRHVVNELIDRFGHPESISIELGRNLPAGAEKRKEIEKEQAENQKKNEAWYKKLEELGKSENRNNILLLRLWEQQDKKCIFSGDTISLANLFNDGEIEIDHLLPFSKTLDDTTANKVICTRESNHYKGQKTPYEAFGASRDGYDWEDIFERVKELPPSKKDRFKKNAMEIWEGKNDFTHRHLNDTRYIGRLAREYLEEICHIDKIDVLTGRLTGLLRGHWGLNSVLQGHNQPEDAQKKKNREDHRHHAVDAIVIGMTNRSMLQRVATEANKAEEQKRKTLFPPKKDGKSALDSCLWEGFRDDVIKVIRNITVSHRAKRKKRTTKGTDGQLHNETAFGIVSGPYEKGKYKGKYKVVTRKPMNYFDTEKNIREIRSPILRKEFEQAFDDAKAVDKKGVEGVEDLARDKGIRHLRCTTIRNVIPFKDKNGKYYKAYQGDSNWGMEIYEYPQNHKDADKWKGVVISRHDANNYDFKPGQTFRPHPAARLVMRLQINDCIEIEGEGKNPRLRLQKMSLPNTLFFVPLNEANVANRCSKGGDLKYFSKSSNALKKLKPRKIHISPTGQVSYENRRKKRHKSKG